MCLYFFFLLNCDLVEIFMLSKLLLYRLDLFGFGSNGLLSGMLPDQKQGCRSWMADAILLQLYKTEVFTIHLQRVRGEHESFPDQGGMQ